MQPLFIGPMDIGLQKNLTPFMIPEKAFPTLFNAYCWRGRVEKKMGFSFTGRLRRELTAEAAGNITSPGAGTVTFNLFTGLGLLTTEPNAQVEPGDITNITIDIGGGIAQTLTDTTGTGTLSIAPAGTITSASINYSTGVLTLVFSGAAGPDPVTVTMAYYPSLPCTGLRLREISSFNSEQTVAFDTKYAYRFNSGINLFEELPSTTPTTWQGLDSQLFWTTNYWQDASNNDIFWATNGIDPNNANRDPIRYYTSTSPTWTSFSPTTNGANELHQCLILIPYKDRLVALNTWEGANIGAAINYPQRARWSQNGDPTDTANGWRDDVVGRGGYVDAPTNEQIVSCGFVKDNLIVYFERSTWILNYTGNEVLPFIWQRINAELGAESTFSNVIFDNGLIAFGNVGLHVCNSTSVTRMDEIIPDEVFTIQNKNYGPQRVYGIRDYLTELVYFTYPDEQLADGSLKFPNKVLVYNYRNDTFSFFRENFTCYGYFQRATGLTWEALVSGTSYAPWSSWSTPWSSGMQQSLVPNVAAGNQQGFVVQLNPETVSNSPTMFIKSLSGVTVTSQNHNLIVGEFVQISGCKGSTNLNGGIYRVESVTTNTFTINTAATGTYIGGGVIKLLSNINITTKMFNPFWSIGKRYRLKNIEFLFDVTSAGELTVNCFVDTGNGYSVTENTNGAVLGSPTVYTKPETLLPQQAQQQQAWHRMYFYTEGETFQVQMVLSDDQMLTKDSNNSPEAAESDIIFHAMVLHFEPAGDFL